MLEKAQNMFQNSAEMSLKHLLTRREIEVLKLIVAEKTSSEIAEELSISIRTVETHRKNISTKTKVRNPIGLVKYAIQSGFIDGYSYRAKKFVLV
jgi:DNA-binding CsgD family transcriptional regulator